jgi:DNA-binding MarR family transcriptional regulator
MRLAEPTLPPIVLNGKRLRHANKLSDAAGRSVAPLERCCSVERRRRFPTDDHDAAIQRFLDEESTFGARYRRALARRMDLEPDGLAALLHLALAGRMSAGQLSFALVLPILETTALIDRLESDGHLSRAADPHGGDFEVVAMTRATGQRLAELTRPLVDDLDAIAERYTSEERAVIGRFLSDVVTSNERHAEAVARRALEGEQGA